MRSSCGTDITRYNSLEMHEIHAEINSHHLLCEKVDEEMKPIMEIR